jgi:very-short-patch-repair endonuclease
VRELVKNQDYYKNKFIIKANKRHSEKYDYSEVEYLNSIEKVKIICKKHGAFWVRPDAHVRKVGCPECNGGVKYTTSTFIFKASKIHENKYDYSEVEYLNSSEKVKIICPIHSYFFMRPVNHLTGQGCPSCSGVRSIDTKSFISISNRVHNNKYDYKDVIYKNNRTKVDIICKTHGKFLQSPKDHMKGHGCKLCNISKGELMLEKKLKILNIEFIREKKFEGCTGVSGSKLPFDFYLPKYNMIIEFNGRQHYEPVDIFGGKKTFEILKKNDERREKWCLENNIKLLKIKWDNIENSLSNIYQEILLLNNVKKNNLCLNSYIEERSEFIEFFQNLNNQEIIIDFQFEKFTCDVFLPKIKIGFKFLGLFKDSELNVKNNRQLILKNEFSKKSYKIIQIFEDQWINKKNIIKSRILKLISNPKKIFARKCQIKEINDNQIIRNFLENNHIQGFVGSRIKLGLFHNDKLVSIMIFGNLRRSLGQKSKEGSYEMLRFCTVMDTIVVGGASKLFKYFINKYNPNKVISYADKLWSDSDNMYNKLDMKFIYSSKPSYYYVVNGERKNRFLYRKDRLISQGFDINLSEHQICKNMGIFRIYDCGTFLYSWTSD